MAHGINTYRPGERDTASTSAVDFAAVVTLYREPRCGLPQRPIECGLVRRMGRGAHPAVARAYALAGLVMETEAEIYAILAVYPGLDPRQVRDDAAARVLARRQPTGPPD